jgi:hypothetical protein
MLESYNNKKLAKIQKKKIREKVLYQQRVHIVTNSNTMLCKRIGERCFFFFIYNIYKYIILGHSCLFPILLFRTTTNHRTGTDGDWTHQR